jgi:hypothetical protein
MTLKTHPLFYSYWSNFYPEGVGNKSFGNMNLAEVSPFAIAVWYMDDGSITGKNYTRFSVGPDPINQQVQLSVLDQFGIKPTQERSPSGFST